MRLLVLAMSGGEMRLTSPGKGRDDNDNPLHFSGEIKDWPTFKEAIQSRAATPHGSSRRHDASDTTWLLEAGRELALFFARQIKDKTGTATTRKKARARESQHGQQSRAELGRRVHRSRS